MIYRGAPGWEGSRLEVLEEQAETVRRIFELRANGAGLRVLAHQLNAEGVASPRGRGWAPSALLELLRNPIYRGERVWNRVQRKKTRSGRLKAFARPESEWQRQHEETWRIVSDELWEHAQAVSRRRRALGAQRARGHRARGKFLLSGLVSCGECGGVFYGVKLPDRWRCHWRFERGAKVCASPLIVSRTELEERVLGAVTERILTPENLAYVIDKACQRVEEELALARSAPEPEAARARLAELASEADRAARLIVRGGLAAQAGEQLLAELEAERERLEGVLTRETHRRVDHAGLRARCEAYAREIGATLTADPMSGNRAFRALLGDRRMRVIADAERGFRVEGIFDVDLGGGGSGDGGDCMVIRARFERATPSFGGWCSIQAELPDHVLVGRTGLEPVTSAV